VGYVRACLAIGVILWTRPAGAADVGDVGGEPVQLDVTETSIAEQHFAARTAPGQAAPLLQPIEDSEWAGWINRLNTSLRWEHWNLGLRLDSAVYAFRPVDQSLSALPAAVQQADRQSIALDNESRFKNSIYPAKLWATYSAPGVEVTAGDAYVQFGRGLTLSMRKVDELGIDTTLRGGKVQITRDPFSITAVAGFANPSRVDEATGRSLWVTSDLAPGDVATPVYGSDRIVGIDLQAGRGLPLTLSTHVVRFSRCAPYHYDANGNIETNLWSDPSTVTFGTCDATDTDLWLSKLNSVPRGLQARDFTMAGQSIEVPSLWGHGTFYAEVAVQQREGDVGETTNLNGNAVYAALSYDIGKTSSTLELKSNRNFYTAAASVEQHAPEFAIVAYSFLPPAESFNMLDAEGTGDFNACVEGGRYREDVNVSPDLLLYGQGVFAYSLTEQPNGHCDELGHTITAVAGISAASVQDVVWDGVTGIEYSFDDRLSHVFASVGARDDTQEDGEVQYREQHLEYSVAKYIGGPWSLEVQGRHRHRKEKGFTGVSTDSEGWWYEGENYVALRMAPKWVFTGGFEYTTLVGQPTTYVNGSAIYKFTSSSNVRVFVGEQRAAFRCASGLCRFFPAFEGARAELTLRF
jgi:Family of unknown function (DUF6029)